MEECTLPVEGSRLQGFSQEPLRLWGAICRQREEKRAARGKHEDFPDSHRTASGHIGWDEKPLGSKRWGSRSRGAATQGAEGVLETDAMRHYGHLCAGSSRQPAEE